MPSYQSPGVYVEEIPSGIQPIAGVSTSTAAFVGLWPTQVVLTSKLFTQESDLSGSPGVITLPSQPANSPSSFPHPTVTVKRVWIPDSHTGLLTTLVPAAGWSFDSSSTKVTLHGSYNSATKARVEYTLTYTLTNSALFPTDAPLPLPQSVVLDQVLATYDGKTLTTWDGTTSTPGTKDATIKLPAGLFIKDWYAFSISTATFTPPDSLTVTNADLKALNATATAPQQITGTYLVPQPYTPVAPLTVKLCTGFNDFQRSFGGFSTDPNQQRLAHAVFGFFDNGGSRCYVVQAENEAGIADALKKLESIDEISIVAAPGLDKSWTDVVSHCERLGDRFAILDCPQGKVTDLTTIPVPKTSDSGFGAYYFPWISVFDPPTQAADPDGAGTLSVPPSGHLAGVYARVDSTRGVHKAPANEVIRGALGLVQTITKAQQAGLNPLGINAIRELNGAIRVWGARTLAGDTSEWKYINVRRLLLYIEESIDEGTQWVVFEPNDPSLWAKITRNVTAFLTNVWRSGALLGSKPEEAFYVRCDAATNPPEVRDLGQVITEVGVAAVRPAEFVIFRISQWAGAGK